MPWKPDFPGERPTLGGEVMDWFDSFNFKVPAGALRDDPFVFRPSQEEWFLNAYEVSESGKRVVRQAINIGPKGAAKTPEGAATAFMELSGPVVFDGWDANGRPVGRPRDDSYIGIVGTSEEQGGNQYNWLYELLSMEGITAAEDLGLEVDLGQIQSKRGGYGTLKTFTASSRTLTGKPVSYWSCEEPWLWTRASGGWKLAKTITNEMRKNNAWIGWYTNPAEVGVGSILEQLLASAAKPGSTMYVHRRAAKLPPQLKDGGIKRAENRKLVIAAIEEAYGDSLESQGGWIDPEQILAGIYDNANTESDGYRLYLGVDWDAATKLVKASQWDSLEDCENPPKPGERVVLSFDGSQTRDSTVLQVWAIDGLRGQTVQAWHRPLGALGEGFRIPLKEVDAAVEYAFRTYDVALMVCDPRGWETSINGWEVKYGSRSGDGMKGDGRIATLATNSSYKNMDAAINGFVAAVESSALSWCEQSVLGDESRMRQHVCAMVEYRRQGSYRAVDSESQGDDDRIDGGIAAILGVWGVERQTMIDALSGNQGSWGASWDSI